MNLKLLSITICSFLMLSNIAFAVLGTPHAFYGSVTVNGSPAPDGTIVAARIGNTEVASTTTVGGEYNFYIDDDSSSRSGDEILFFVAGVNTGQIEYFYNGDVTELDLSVTLSSTTTTATGGGGGAVPTSGTTTDTTETSTSGTTTTSLETGCQERWTCSDWSTCDNGIQTRVCEDQNSCGTNSREPFTSQPCTAGENEKASAGGSLGFFFMMPSDMVLVAVSVGVVAVLFTFFMLKRKSAPVPVVVVG
ncbi:MAG: hypothetical protein JW700_03220 [Candidatus Aenigmarchaeota archaeon]|nr:hypothetical protein [Candidatus Aenigmarchaeota archaeon]